MSRKRPFTREELLSFARQWIDQFGHLGELCTIRHVLQEISAHLGTLHDDLELLGVRLAGGRP